ncbi:NUDIX hydrolase [Salinibacterium soli]|uniref:NUDIX domain-containing protein n=1 Tax=Antiquaquibacter soli TaxID=3064523 RepID=A0ABT9BVH9_9MICO|nr:NUDIX domain-containing protein [Protaetiibacter sp. WY-16]MDO7883347.1 NUDIX domain-containing protein [Protaetiibacter sp. WY-16]
MTDPVVAAGVVCWRLIGKQARVLLVHRTQHKDVSLPKGKVDPGELLPQTAVRELQEETGLSVALGAPLGEVHYTLPNGRPKVVYYWSAEVDDHALELARFRANDEIAALEWLPLDKAVKKVSYEHDVEMIEALRARLKAGTARTFAIVVARHGKAVPPGTWDGPDSTRPLMHRGTDQAAAIAPSIAAFAPEKIISSSAARCVATVTPLSELTGMPIKQTAAISQDAYEFGQSSVPEVVAKRLKRKDSVVLCSHGPVIPHIVSEIAHLTGAAPSAALRTAAMPSTGDFSVLHVSRAKRKLVAVESHSPG